MSMQPLNRVTAYNWLSGLGRLPKRSFWLATHKCLLTKVQVSNEIWNNKKNQQNKTNFGLTAT
jgi:hypothetical protein